MAKHNDVGQCKACHDPAWETSTPVLLDSLSEHGRPTHGARGEQCARLELRERRRVLGAQEGCCRGGPAMVDKHDNGEVRRVGLGEGCDLAQAALEQVAAGAEIKVGRRHGLQSPIVLVQAGARLLVELKTWPTEPLPYPPGSRRALP